MREPTLPIFVVEGLDVGVYESIEDAQVSLEPWWVKQKEGVVYDAEGRLLKLEAGKNRVIISLDEEEPTHAAVLEKTLREFLTAIGEPIGKDISCDLSCLVDFCRKFIYRPVTLKEFVVKSFRKLITDFRKRIKSHV